MKTPSNSSSQRSHHVASFPPQVGAHCRILVLGTAPSRRSLELRQSYGHAHNLFWTFMGEMFGAGRELAYTQRMVRLHACGVGIWDVYKRVEREGSLDSAIVRASEVPNAIARLLARYPTIRAIALNGGRAAQGFQRHIEPTLTPAQRARIEVLALPSTSPANASMSRAAKFEKWRALLRHASCDGAGAAKPAIAQRG